MPVVEYEKQGHIAVVTLDRNEARNAINPEVAVRLSKAWEEVRNDDEVRVAVVTGTGDSTFCAGADLGRLITLFTGVRKAEDEWDEKIQKNPSLLMKSLLREFDPEKPIIAALNGHAIAGGLEIMLATDIRVSVAEAKFGLQEAKWAIFPAGGSTVRLPRQIPYAHAMEMMLTGNLIDANRALELGLINKIVERKDLMASAMEYAETIAGNGPLAVKAIRKSVRACIGLTEKEGLAMETRLASPIMMTEDAREGPRAFKEKRKPVFKGR